MGLFSKKVPDSKARIEELKKKIQAEQAAFAQSSTPPTAPPPPAPVQQPPAAQTVAPAPAMQQPVQQPPQQPAYAPVQTWQQPSPATPAQPVYYEAPRQPQPRQHAPLQLPEELFEEDTTIMEEIKTGIILDLGDGMSLNLPIRSRMRLDEFLRIADRVRELQKAQVHQQQY